MTDDYTPPTPDEIARVAAYWRRVELLACQHESGFTFGNTLGTADARLCSDCNEPLIFLTQVQLDARIQAAKVRS